MTIFAPAKINLHLAVLDKRADGFHNLESVFLALKFGDTLHFEPIPGKNALELAMKGAFAPEKPIPVEKNIIFRALSLFREKTGFEQGLSIIVEKRIPIGGGLGGGSSNAAGTLLALNKLAGSALPKDALLEMAGGLGSDVPFFVHETGSAHVSGRGEIIESLEMPLFRDLSFALVNPGFPSDTAEAYRLLDEHRSQFNETQNRAFSESPVAALYGDPASWNFRNDFLQIFPEREKLIYSKIISQLREQGADFAGLNGAGSTCFGVFKESELAQKAAQTLRNAYKFAEYAETQGIRRKN